MKHCYWFWLFLEMMWIAPAFAQEVNDAGCTKNRSMVEGYFKSIDNNKEYSPNERMVAAAKYLLQTPYVAGTLDSDSGDEQLTIDFCGMDCMTFVESCMALSYASQLPYQLSYDDFVRELQYIRYRDGRIQGYTSRLHYATDWIHNNVAKKMIENRTDSLGGKPFQPNVNFMTTHPDLYTRLKENRGNLETMNQIENRINQSNNNYFIPCSQINATSSLIQSGDIIFFTTNIPGLDVAHAGIAYWSQGKLCLIHASSTAKQVVISDQSLSQYCRSKKSFTGIIVLRTLPVMFTTIESD
ncbi:MAG: DUF1460 domain-containing protein [Dysgonamonadaceae bacterium]|jgi:cell wall-associated NlpC family hydrolase|nr:DUF1460 domain-containing protein [Dysgonamonadaceae bacterium]